MWRLGVGLSSFVVLFCGLRVNAFFALHFPLWFFAFRPKLSLSFSVLLKVDIFGRPIIAVVGFISVRKKIVLYDNNKSLGLMKRGGIIFVGSIMSCELASTHEPGSYSGLLGKKSFINSAITDYHSCWG